MKESELRRTPCHDSSPIFRCIIGSPKKSVSTKKRNVATLLFGPTIGRFLTLPGSGAARASSERFSPASRREERSQCRVSWRTLPAGAVVAVLNTNVSVAAPVAQQDTTPTSAQKDKRRLEPNAGSSLSLLTISPSQANKEVALQSTLC